MGIFIVLETNMITKIAALVNLVLLIGMAFAKEKVSAWVPIIWILIYFINSFFNSNKKIIIELIRKE